MKDLNIMTVCGFGIGSSLILKMTVDSVTSVTDQGVDLLLVSNELYPQVKDKVSCPILIIENFVDEAEVEEKLLPKVKELAGE